MRKFNLKGNVADRMKGIPLEDPVPATETETKPEKELMNPGFTEEQGQFQCAWRTDVGKLRKNNQDAVILGNGLAGVADGMGGHNGGEIASAGLRDGLLRETKDLLPDGEALKEAVRKVNYELWEQQENDASLSGMGTTLTVLWPSKGKMIIGQIGDSRAYLFRNGELSQVTNDHSMVADMVRKGVLTEEQAACHPMRNYITRAVGTETMIEVDMSVHDRKKGDRWLICSDGLHGTVFGDELIQMMMNENLDEAADKMLQAALNAGGKDNISLILLQDDTDDSDSEDNNTEDTENEAEASVDKESSEEVNCP